MIVIYAWRTKKIKDNVILSTTHWRGAFLFGIIPLAIWVTGKTWKV